MIERPLIMLRRDDTIIPLLHSADQDCYMAIRCMDMSGMGVSWGVTRQSAGAVPRSGQTLFSVQAGGWTDPEQSGWEGLGGAAGWAGLELLQPRKPNVSWPAPKAPWAEAKGGDSGPLSHSSETPSGELHPVLGFPAQEGHGPLEWTQKRPPSWCEGWGTSPMRKGWEHWDCSAWRKHGFWVT